MKKSLFTVMLLLASVTLLGQNIGSVEKKTFLYAVKGQDSLYLDKYDLPAITGTKPCVIFVFGGGFVTGERDKSEYQQYFDVLSKSGYTVVSIDYRLGLKNLSLTSLNSPMEFIQKFQNSIDVAVEDLFDATSFILEHADEWNINKEQLIATGSSAGAVTVLQGEYNIANNTTLTQKLPNGFNYAGIISFAGAIFSMNGDLVWANNPCPIQLFHGDADRNVPFDKITADQLGFYGSKYIARQLKEKNLPYYFYEVRNAEHEIAGTPMSHNLNEIETFIQKIILQKQPLAIETEVNQIGKPEMEKDFEIMDYVRANFGM